MRRLLSALFVMTLVATAAYADYRIVFLNTPSIKIGGKALKVNDVFDGKGAIEWSSPRQAMKVIDIPTGRQKLIVAEPYKKSKAADLIGYLKGIHHLSTRAAPNNIVSLRAMVSDRFFLTDSISFPTDFKTDRDRFFYVSYEYAGETINKRIFNSEGTFSITKDIFTIDGREITPFDVTLSLYYLDNQTGKNTLVSDGMQVICIPDSIAP